MNTEARDSVAWIDLVDPDRAAIEAAVAKTLHPRALEQLLAPHEHEDDPRPTIEDHDDYVFGILLVPVLQEDGLTVRYQEVDLVAAQDVLLTVRKTCGTRGPFDCSAVQRLHERGRAASAGLIVYRLADAVAEGFLDLIDRLNERIGELDNNVDEWDPSEIRAQLKALQGDLLQVRQRLSPTREAIRRVMDDRVDARDGGELFDRDVELHLADVNDKLLRASDALDLSRELVAGVRDYHQAKIANDQNEVMKRLTIIASLLLVPSFVVGFYGMNVRGEPEYRWSFGYEFVLAVIIVLTLAQLVWFRRRRWL